jgi:hypothetical protein
MRLSIGRLGRFAPVVAMAAILMVPTTAVAATTSFQIVSANLIAKGVEVDVTVSFTCTAGDVIPAAQNGFGGGLTANIQQAVSKTQQASGSGQGGGLTCTGSPQTGVIQVIAFTSGPPFRKGPAVITANINECDPLSGVCTFTSTPLTTVRIS